MTSAALAMALLPASIRRLLQAGCSTGYMDVVRRYAAMEEADLQATTRMFLKNLDRLDGEDDDSADADLRHVLVPEIWDRLQPGVGLCRDLRRISTSLAEYDPRSSTGFWARIDPAGVSRLHERSVRLRDRIARAASLGTTQLVEATRFAIAGSRSWQKWLPTDPVYEPGFVFRLIPVIARRVLDLRGRDDAPVRREGGNSET
jgi:hypothetical protein